MTELLDALLAAPRDPAAIQAITIPDHYRAVTLHRDDASMFDGIPSQEKDPRRSLHYEDVPTPQIGPQEALIAVMASSINYNTVWSSIFEPVPTFDFLRRYARVSSLTRRHDLPYHVVGSDLSGVVLRVGAAVTAWQPGDEVVAHCLSVDLESPEGHDDSLLDPQQRIWGYETNFGGLGHLALVKSNQLLPKPTHLTWEEAAVSGLVNSTAFRQLVSRHGAEMSLGDIVLIWGAAGGLGSYATQLALRAGAIPVCVVSSSDKVALCRAMGAELVIDRSEHGFEFWKDETTPNTAELRRFGGLVRELTAGMDPDVVFEHPGQATFAASVYACARGGTVVTCASTSGHLHTYDNRYLWMKVKRIIGSHFANYREASRANRLIERGMIHPTLSRVYPLARVGEAAFDVHRNRHHGKIGIRCLAPTEGLGVSDQEKRHRHLAALTRFRH